MNTVLAPSMGGLFALATKQWVSGEQLDSRLDFQALTNGILAGLVCVTAGCNCVDPWAAIVIGCLGSISYSLACRLGNYFKVDDPLEAFQVHGFCGMTGVICVAFFKKDQGLIYTF